MRTKRWLACAGIVAVVAVTLLIAACGGGGENGSQVTPTATKPRATKAAPKTPTRPAPTATEGAATDPLVQTPTYAPPPPTYVPPPDPPTQTPVERVIVDVPHWEWEMHVSRTTAPPGTLTFNAINQGTIPHNLRLAKTNRAPGALPVIESTFMVDEGQLVILAASRDLNPGESEALTVELGPGNYVFFCNVAAHYQTGLYAAFTVE